ncbi:homing endonuclease [Orpheovirus IHUMI-LCC2]|uniref:Endonuclease-like protein n=1 Tax=Orpheovirus IHUMI-LCC2 TaxID=2023057 RepID=A0A2I2L5B2_9VIRU|nr:homing endonuclease [Orpheovirus IHUMI-LCC2]SNW62723.1 Putative endonuclease-like protein [Orpheovirus IHUMI-LCC2]
MYNIVKELQELIHICIFRYKGMVNNTFISHYFGCSYPTWNEKKGTYNHPDWIIKTLIFVDVNINSKEMNNIRLIDNYEISDNRSNEELYEAFQIKLSIIVKSILKYIKDKGKGKNAEISKVLGLHWLYASKNNESGKEGHKHWIIWTLLMKMVEDGILEKKGDYYYIRNYDIGLFRKEIQWIKTQKDYEGELRIANKLKSMGINFIRQYSHPTCKDKSLLYFDFYLPDLNIMIEFDGSQHDRPVQYFGGETAFKLTVLHDEIKNSWCLRNKIRMIRIPYKKIKSIHNILPPLIYSNQ